MMKGITLIEVIVVICIIDVLILTYVPVVSNNSHKIDHGEVVDKNYTAGYSSYRGKNGNAEELYVTIDGEEYHFVFEEEK